MAKSSVVAYRGAVRVLAFTKYARSAASTRQRLLQYLPYLAEQGIEVTCHALLDDAYVRTIGTAGLSSRARVAGAYAARLRTLSARHDADVLWIYGELFPYLPAWFERLAFRSCKPVVYDCDDAFFHLYDASPSPAVRYLLGKKLEPLLRGAAACACGNDYLRDYAARYCENTIVLPTVVDTKRYVPGPPKSNHEAPVIGWIGSPSTYRYLEAIMPLLGELARTRGVKVRVVGAGPAAATDRFAGLELVDWSEQGEIAAVQAMDIGIMPTADELWAKGKCGYKLIQYMACGLPVVSSPVGVGAELVLRGPAGLLASTPDQWRTALETLIADPDLRAAMGKAGRARAESDFSLAVHAPRFAGLLREAAGARPPRARTDGVEA